ncbi:hypothetical protein QYH69_22365, partial [Paraburkholderia sp. SARCC-3016]|uniref:hypothetical protein n=1 Tax=Paraburkholderia sp. SARCC-3016 TaxID=3058611 RepID=UPI00280724AC
QQVFNFTPPARRRESPAIAGDPAHFLFPHFLQLRLTKTLSEARKTAILATRHSTRKWLFEERPSIDA